MIEPHLGGLKNLTAAMPHPRGKIEVSYVVGTSGTTARIVVPDGVSAKFIWHGRTYALRSGEQSLQLP
jgi:hypothetical protein